MSQEANFTHVILTAGGFVAGAYAGKSYVAHTMEEATRFTLDGARDFNRGLYKATGRPSQVVPYRREA